MEPNDPQLVDRVAALENKLDLVLSKLDTIQKGCDTIQEGCGKMSNHIDFVNGVYDRIKTPFHYIMNKVSLYSTKNTNYIEDKPLVAMIGHRIKDCVGNPEVPKV